MNAKNIQANKNLYMFCSVLLIFFHFGFISFPNKADDLLKFHLSDRQTKTFNQSMNQKISMENLFAWCIVPYDSKKRTPEERIAMLKELGFKSYAYDWREEHLNSTVNELRIALENGIKINAIWIWIDGQFDKPGQLSASNEKIFSALKETVISTQIWIGFNENYFSGLNHEKSLNKGIEMLRYLDGRAKESGSKIALYNHGGWFGEPENQVEMIERLPECEIGMIYNFHHGHEQIEQFPQLIKIMKPYLWAVNLNGMKKDGPKILTIGEGDKEAEMIKLLLNYDFNGPYGIIGHTEGEDVKKVLERNLNGLRSLGFVK